MSREERTINAALRVQETTYRTLQEDAKSRNISLNTIVNQILRAYAECDRYYAPFGMVKITRPTLVHILNATMDVALAEAGGVSGADISPSAILTKRGEVTVPTILEHLKTIGVLANFADYAEVIHAGRISVTLSHEMGPKWSLFLANYVEAIFKSIGVRVMITQRDNSISFEVPT